MEQGTYRRINGARGPVLPALLLPALLVLGLLLPGGCGQGEVYDITRFGAAGDGTTVNTEAIQEAIDRCAGAGGGRVVVPPGRFVTGTVELKDHVELHLEQGAVLLGSTDISDYPERTTPYRFYGDEWVRQSLIFALERTGIALTGQGVIDGQGAAFRATTKKKPDRYRNRPYLIRMTGCSDITVTGLTLRNSAMWMQHYLACENLLIRGIRVWNHCNKNNDMIDIDGCRNVVITGCIGDTDDDALTFKSTSPHISENITVSNCILSSHCNAIKFGTETTGGFRNVTLTGCVIKPSEKEEVIYGFPRGISGVSLQMVDGGIMENIVISDVVIDGPEVPLFIRLGNRGRKHYDGAEQPGVGTLRDVIIRDISAVNCGSTGCSVTGIPGHPVENIRLEGIRIHGAGGISAGEVPGEVAELETLYPEATMFDTLPSSLFFIRHARNVTLAGIDASFAQPDGRPHVIADHVTELFTREIRVEGQPSPVIRTKHTTP